MVFLVDACPFSSHKKSRRERRDKRQKKQKREVTDGGATTDEEDDDFVVPEKPENPTEEPKPSEETDDGGDLPDDTTPPTDQTVPQTPPQPPDSQPQEQKNTQDLATNVQNNNIITYEDCMAGFPPENEVTADYLKNKFDNKPLSKYQVELLNVLQHRRRALAWWRTGAGKTRMGVTAAANFRAKYKNGRIIVVSLAAVRPTWQEEVARVVLDKRGQTRKVLESKTQQESANIYFYDVSLPARSKKKSKGEDVSALKSITDVDLGDIPVDPAIPTLLIFDEIQKQVLGGSSTTDKFFNLLANLRINSNNRILALSATPFKVEAKLIYLALSLLVYGTSTDAGIRSEYGDGLLEAIINYKQFVKDNKKVVRGETPEKLSKLYDAAKEAHVSTCMFNCYFEEGKAFPNFDVTQMCVPLADECFDAFWKEKAQTTPSEPYKYIKWATDYFDQNKGKEVSVNPDENVKDDTYENTCFLVKSMKTEFEQDNKEFLTYKRWKDKDQKKIKDIDVDQIKSLISPKMYWLALTLANKASGRFVVFFYNTAPLKVFLRLLERGEVSSDDIEYIAGEVKTGDRQNIKNWYNKSSDPNKPPTGKKILLLNISAAGTGLDLKWTTALYFMQMEFSPVDFYQAVGRGVRRGSHGGEEESSRSTVEVYVVSQQTKRLGFKDARFNSVKEKTKEMIIMIEREQKYCIGNNAGVNGLIEASKKWSELTDGEIQSAKC